MPDHIKVSENILSFNDEIAKINRKLLDEYKLFSINIMASPGAGKTSAILKTFEQITGKFKLGMVDGDLASSIDADKANQSGISAVQINTGGGCHLDAKMVNDALKKLPLGALDALVVENVGNLVCPANFDLGTDKNILIASIPEGDDKPYKYPGIYRGVDALIINKDDLLPYIEFDLNYFKKGVEILNPGLVTFPISCVSGEGIADWVKWFTEHIFAKKGT